MKTRLLWIAIFAVGLTALYFGVTQPHVSTLPRHIREPLADLPPPSPPPLEPPTLLIPPLPTLTPPVLRPMLRNDPVLGVIEVPIQDGATIDFSRGGPVVKFGGPEQDALDRALKEIATAAHGTTFEAKK